jgi:hypothetical protein
VFSGLDVEVDNSEKSSASVIPAYFTRNSDVRNIENMFQLPERSDRLHEVAKKATSRM